MAHETYQQYTKCGGLYLPNALTLEQLRENKINYIKSGLGSGKTSLANKIAEDHIVLLATSRVTKVSQTIYDVYDENKAIQQYTNNIWMCGNIYDEGLIHADHYDEWEYVPHEFKKFRKFIPGLGIVYNQSSCITFSKIDYFLRKIYDKYRDRKMYLNHFEMLWHLYDYFIFDEVQSIVTNANYQDAPFAVWSFIKAFDKYCDIPGKTMILMSGTPEPIDKLINQLHNVKMYDFMDESINITPSRVELVNRKTAISQIEDIIKNEPDASVFYFQSGSAQTVAEFCSDKDIDPNVVVTTFSDKQKRDVLSNTDKEAYLEMIEAELDIEKNKQFPNDKRLLVSTSRYEDGIEIYTDVTYLYVSAHDSSTVMQMSGRLRAGNHILRIIVDAKEFASFDDYMLQEQAMQCEKNDVKKINNAFSKITDSDKNKFISSITDELYQGEGFGFKYYNYVRFNYFEERFEFDITKQSCVEYYKKAFMAWHKRNSNDVSMGRISPAYFKNIVAAWFPTIPVSEYVSNEYLIKCELSKYIKNHTRTIDTKKYNEIKNTLADIWGEPHAISWFLDRIGIPWKIKRNESTKQYQFIKTS